MESGGNDPEIIASQLSDLAGYDVYCLCEVHSKSFDRYASAVRPGFVSIISKSGRGDRLQIIVNGERFELLGQKELDRIGDYEMNNGYCRAPMFVRQRDGESGLEFIVMTNHLARDKPEIRKSKHKACESGREIKTLL